MGVSTGKRAASDALAAQQLLDTYNNPAPGNTNYQNPDVLAQIQQDQATSQELATKAAQPSGGIGGFLEQYGTPILTAASLFTPLAPFAPLIAAAGDTISGLAQGEDLGQSLESGGIGGLETFAGQELAPAVGNLFSDTAPVGGNSLTDLLGQTTGQGSLFGAGTIGGELGSLTGDAGSVLSGAGNSISNLFSPAAGTDLASGTGGNFSYDINGNSPSLTAGAPGATAPSAISSAYTPSAGTGSLAGAGGGGVQGAVGAGGVALSPDTGLSATGTTNALPWETPGYVNPAAPLDSSIAAINPGTTDYSNGIGASPNPTGGISNSIQNLFSPASQGATGAGANYDLSGNPVGASTLTAPQQLTDATGSAISPQGVNMPPSISQIFGNAGGQTGAGGVLGNGSGVLGGLLKAGIMGGLNNPNNKGYDAQIAAGQNIENLYNPFVTTGNQANTTLANLFGENGADAGAQAAAQANFANTPGYQFALNQGENAINANAAATGQTLSGNNQQAIQNYGTGLANQTYNQYVNNLQNQVGTGLSAAGGVATGLAGVGNAQAGKSGAAASNQNAAIGGAANALFPPSYLQSLSQLFGGAGNANPY